MNKLAISFAVSAVFLTACDKGSESVQKEEAKAAKVEQTTVKVQDEMKKTPVKPDRIEGGNPFFMVWETPFGIPPFDKIENKHYKEAFDVAIKKAKEEIEMAANSDSEPTFENTIEALEYGGKDLTRVANVFFNLTSAHTNSELQAISRKVGPLLSSLNDDINLNPKLFARVKAVYDKRNELGLRADQMKLLEDRYKGFVRGGAELSEEQKGKLRELNQKLSELTIQFGENVLAENNNWEMVLEKKEDLVGLPQNVIDAAAETAKKRGHEGKWVFTTHRPSKNPFLIYSTNRDLRERIYQGYINRGDNDNANDNKKVAAKIAALRSQKATLMGYKNHADFILESRVAKNADNVYKLLDQIWPAAIKQAQNEVALMQKMIDEEGGDFKFRASDWRHYSEKILKADYQIDQEIVKPYFSLENTLQGVFYIANKLYGMNFKERFDLPTYHEDVRTFEVRDPQGELIGIYLTDFYVRESKRGGAWMNSYRKQYVDQNGKFHKPIIVNVLNYPRPVGDEPTLLTFDQASTLFHEFGHAAHGFLSNGVYPSQTGTSVPRDFVEFPSQVHENWMTEPEVLAQFAKHYKTGEVIPQQLVEKIQAASKFNQGFATTEYMAATLLDLAWHTIDDGEIRDADAFENKVLEKYGLISEIAPRYRTTYFSHIFSGGYSAGYYSYIWSDIFGADAYQAFRENGIFDEKTAKAFVDNVLSKGGTEDPLTLYKKFRGKEADPKYLLKSRGLID